VLQELVGFCRGCHLEAHNGGDSSGVWAGGGILRKGEQVLVHNTMTEKMETPWHKFD